MIFLPRTTILGSFTEGYKGERATEKTGVASVPATRGTRGEFVPRMNESKNDVN